MPPKEPPKAPDPLDDTVRLRVEEVVLPVSVRSSAGRLPTYLEPSDFIIAEDGKRQRVTSVARSPANVLFIIDAGGEADIGKSLSLARDLALSVINTLGPEDRGAIISYADSIDLLAGWTADKEALRHALQTKLRPGVKSRFHACLSYAAVEVLPKVTGRRSVVLIGDGVDTDEGALFQDSLKAMHEARATLYVTNQTVWLNRELSRLARNPLARFEMLDRRVRKRYNVLRRYLAQSEAAAPELKRLVEETGGALWLPEEREEFTALGRQIAGEVETEYVVTYVSEREPDDRRFREVKVFASRPDLVLRVRRGVYPNRPADVTAAQQTND